MKCSLCGYEFKEEDAVKSCKSCPFIRNCNMIKCPNCGYETILSSSSRGGAIHRTKEDKKNVK